MNERQAIEFIMQEIKEQRRADFQFYLEMRNQSTATYERFLDRLRELDERETVEPKYKPAPGLIIPPSLREELVKEFKELPTSKAHGMSSQELRVDKYEEEQPKKRISSDEVTTAIEEYLKRVNRWVDLTDIKRAIEKQFNHEWANFSTNMRRALEVSPHIDTQKITERKFLYRYKEV